MSKRRHTELFREGLYAAEVDVELIEADDGWSPYLSLDDAHKLDAVREALRRGDIQGASRHAGLFSLTPVRGERPERTSTCSGRDSAAPRIRSVIQTQGGTTLLQEAD